MSLVSMEPATLLVGFYCGLESFGTASYHSQQKITGRPWSLTSASFQYGFCAPLVYFTRRPVGLPCEVKRCKDCALHQLAGSPTGRLAKCQGSAKATRDASRIPKSLDKSEGMMQHSRSISLPLISKFSLVVPLCQRPDHQIPVSTDFKILNFSSPPPKILTDHPV